MGSTASSAYLTCLCMILKETGTHKRRQTRQNDICLAVSSSVLHLFVFYFYSYMEDCDKNTTAK